MSSSSGTLNLGSKISIIFKAQIHCEGILYTIDWDNATVVLAKVRSFGTEDRPTCIHSASLCLLVGAFNPFMFKVITDKYDPVAI